MDFKKALKNSKNILYENSAERLLLKVEIVDNGNVDLLYGIENTPFGRVLIAKTSEGLSDLLFITGDEEVFIQKFFNKRTGVNFIKDNNFAKPLIEQIFYAKDFSGLKICLSGTPFQLSVWQALLNIPSGYVVSYSDVAEFIERPGSSRAVGSAVGKNPLHFLIPCHRVIKNDGKLGGFAAGIDRKFLLLESEI